MLRLLHTLLAACVLAATTGWVSAEHLCAGVVKSRAHFAAAEPCAHATTQAPVCPHHPTPTAADADDCCDDEAQLDKAEDLLDYAPVALLAAPAPLRPAYPPSLADACDDPTPAATWAARYYRPPPLGPPTALTRLAHWGEWRC